MLKILTDILTLSSVSILKQKESVHVYINGVFYICFLIMNAKVKSYLGITFNLDNWLPCVKVKQWHCRATLALCFT